MQIVSHKECFANTHTYTERENKKNKAHPAQTSQKELVDTEIHTSQMQLQRYTHTKSAKKGHMLTHIFNTAEKMYN